jgi:ssDNA-binding Zn-finger/Zn-ribbon topoisomerase 1
MPRQAGVRWLFVKPRRQAVGLHALIEGSEDMKRSDRGLKHVCPECEIKYYDLRKEVFACPRCGAKPLAAKVPKARQPAGNTGRATIRRYP